MQGLDVLLVLLFLGRPFLGVAVTESSCSLSAPQNLTIQSHNFQNVLKWSPVEGINGSVTYRVEWRYAKLLSLEKDTWREMNCTNIIEPKCDFYHIFDFVKIILRVRAEEGELKSAWTESSPFQPRSHTTLGLPRAIDVSSEGNTIHVNFLPPFEHTDFIYLIYYWEESTNEKMIYSSKNRINTFKNLKERTMYCFQVQAELLQPNLQSQISDPYCRETTITDATRILHAILIFAFAGFVLCGIFLCVVFRKHTSIIKSLWKSPLTIPSHFEEDLKNLQMTVVDEFQNCTGDDHWDIVSEISSAEQSNFTNENQEHQLKMEEHG